MSEQRGCNAKPTVATIIDCVESLIAKGTV
jgi:hypothetical protein